MNNGCTFNRSKRLDIWENNDEDWIANYFILFGIGGDNTYQSMNVKTWCGSSSSSSSKQVLHYLLCG